MAGKEGVSEGEMLLCWPHRPGGRAPVCVYLSGSCSFQKDVPSSGVHEASRLPGVGVGAQQAFRSHRLLFKN